MDRPPLPTTLFLLLRAAKGVATHGSVRPTSARLALWVQGKLRSDASKDILAGQHACAAALCDYVVLLVGRGVCGDRATIIINMNSLENWINLRATKNECTCREWRESPECRDHFGHACAALRRVPSPEQGTSASTRSNVPESALWRGRIDPQAGSIHPQRRSTNPRRRASQEAAADDSFCGLDNILCCQG